MTVILKNCPFCGSKASLHQGIKTEEKWNSVFSVSGLGSIGYNTSTSRHQYIVSCNKCRASVGPYSTQNSAEKAWNRREEKENG